MFGIAIGETGRRVLASVFLTAAAVIGLLVIAPCSPVFGQEDKFPVPENIRTDGVPSINKSEIDRVFVDPSKFGGNLIWDTDTTRRRLLVTDSSNEVYSLGAPMETPKRLFQGIYPSSVRFRPGSSQFAFVSDFEDEDNAQVYLSDTVDAKPKLIAAKSGDDSITGIVWSRDGKALYYVRTDYDKKTSRLCVHDLVRENCFDQPLKGAWEAIAVDGKSVFLKFWRSSSSQELHEFDLSKRALSGVETVGNNRRAAAFGGRAYWTNENGGLCPGRQCVMTKPIGRGRSTVLKLPKEVTSIQDMRLSPNGRFLMILELKDGIDRLRIFEIRGAKVVRTLPWAPDSAVVVWHARWLGGNELAYTAEHIGQPPVIMSHDFVTGRDTVWTRVRMPDEFRNRLSPPEPIKWKSTDGLEISGYIVKPANAKGPLPSVIFIHGGPQTVDRPVFGATETALVSALGMAVIHTNIRGSSGSGTNYMDADNGGKRINAINDIRSLIDLIETRRDLDPKRIILRGQSYGGWIALGAALAEPTRVRGVIAEYPLVSIRGMLGMSWADDSLFAEYGNPKDEELMKKLDSLSPLNNTDRWNARPVLLTRGGRDERSPEANITDLKNQLRAKGSDVWWIYLVDAGHGAGGRYVNAAVFTFLKKYL